MEIISRKEAIEKGLKRYFTGKPCKYGHVSERNVSKCDCLTCQREYYQQNKEHVSDRNKKWKEENKERYREYKKEYNKKYNKEYYQQNKKQINESKKEYFRNRYLTDNDFKTLKICRGILERTLRATVSTKDTRTYEMLGYCNEQIKESIESKFLYGMSWESYGDWHIDHIYPVTRYIKDGVEDPAIINSLYNLIPMWAEHNLEKSDRTLEEYLEDRKDLVELYGRFL